MTFIAPEFAGAVDCIHDEKTFRCVQYVRNYDADTITFNIPKTHPLLGKEANIRVFGVDTPEIRTRNKLEKAYKSDKKNPDVLNYMGFTTRKVGNFDQAEKYYLKGLSLEPNHNGINEYLGELYVQTNRIDKAKERLEILKGCNCDEYGELELIIKTRGSKVY